MKIEQEKNNVIRSEAFQETNYRIEASPFAYKVLSSGLYSDPIKAILREYLTNACDAHIDAGIPDKAVDVYLPNKLEPSYKVRDYGKGLSPEEISTVFTVYFGSNKQNTNSLQGCFGLGAKSALSYTDAFTITSFNKGKKYIYAAFLNEEGFPSLNLLSETETDEPSGLEVSVAVKEEDVYQFQNKAQLVFSAIVDVPLNVKGVVRFEKLIDLNKVDKEEHFVEIGDNSAAYIVKRSYSAGIDRFLLSMGNVFYAITEPSQSNKLGELALLYGLTRATYSVVVSVPTGFVMPTPSRESIQNEERIIQLTEKALDLFIERKKKEIEKKVDTSSIKTFVSSASDLSIRKNAQNVRYGDFNHALFNFIIESFADKVKNGVPKELHKVTFKVKCGTNNKDGIRVNKHTDLSEEKYLCDFYRTLEQELRLPNTGAYHSLYFTSDFDFSSTYLNLNIDYDIFEEKVRRHLAKQIREIYKSKMLNSSYCDKYVSVYYSPNVKNSDLFEAIPGLPKPSKDKKTKKNKDVTRTVFDLKEVFKEKSKMISPEILSDNKKVINKDNTGYFVKIFRREGQRYYNANHQFTDYTRYVFVQSLDGLSRLYNLVGEDLKEDIIGYTNDSKIEPWKQHTWLGVSALIDTLLLKGFNKFTEDPSFSFDKAKECLIKHMSQDSCSDSFELRKNKFFYPILRKLDTTSPHIAKFCSLMETDTTSVNEKEDINVKYVNFLLELIKIYDCYNFHLSTLRTDFELEKNLSLEHKSLFFIAFLYIRSQVLNNDHTGNIYLKACVKNSKNSSVHALDQDMADYIIDFCELFEKRKPEILGNDTHIKANKILEDKILPEEIKAFTEENYKFYGITNRLTSALVEKVLKLQYETNIGDH